MTFGLINYNCNFLGIVYFKTLSEPLSNGGRMVGWWNQDTSVCIIGVRLPTGAREFQQRMFPFIWVPKLSLYLDHGNYRLTQQLLFLFTDRLLLLIRQSQSQSYIMTDCQSASLSWCQAPIRDPPQMFLLLSLIIGRQLWICLCDVFLWWEVGSVVFSFSWASLAQPFSGLSPTGLMSIFHCLDFWDSPNLEVSFLYLFPSRTGYHSYTPGHWVLLATTRNCHCF
jgi:hypothetical protein